MALNDTYGSFLGLNGQGQYLSRLWNITDQENYKPIVRAFINTVADPLKLKIVRTKCLYSEIKVLVNARDAFLNTFT